MADQKIFELLPVYVEFIPEQLDEGKLYISEKFGVCIHLCGCGCKGKTVCDLQPQWKTGWKMVKNDGLITLRPSIGNFNGEKPYHAHYFITNSKIEWLK